MILILIEQTEITADGAFWCCYQKQQADEEISITTCVATAVWEKSSLNAEEKKNRKKEKKKKKGTLIH